MSNQNLHRLKSVWQKWRPDFLLGIVGINLLAIFTYLGNRQDLLHPIEIYLSLMVVAFGFFAYASITVQNRFEQHNRSLLSLILIFGILFRLVLIHGFPSLSTDIYRYIWDGKLTCHWVNPYRWSPWDTRLAQYRDIAIWQPMEYKAYASVYMPVSQLFFAVSYGLFSENIAGFKIVFTLCDIAVMCLTAIALAKLGKDPARVIWYAWCPLPIIEVALAGHQDVTGVMLLMLALIAGVSGRISRAGVAVAAAGLTKGFALLLLPLFARVAGRRIIVVIAVTMIYLGLPLIVYLPQYLHGMAQYLGYVHVNSGVFSWVDMALAWLTPWHFEITSKLANLSILSAVGWSVWTKPTNYEEIIRRAIIVISVCLLVVPTLFPWYMVWVLPLVTLYRRRPSAAFFSLSLLVNLVYIYYFNRSVYWWVTPLEYLPFYAILWWEVKRGYWRALTDEADVSGLSERTTSADESVSERAGLTSGVGESSPPVLLWPDAT